MLKNLEMAVLILTSMGVGMIREPVEPFTQKLLQIPAKYENLRRVYGCLYAFSDKSYLCWTAAPDISYVIEYDSSTISDAGMYKALLKLDAPQTAEALQEFTDLMPAGTFEHRVMPE